VRKVVRNSGGKRIKLMWAPYVRSVPDTPENAISVYFPGAEVVDLVGASGYNFGQVGGLAWTEPEALFEDVYRQVSALTPKPFWVAETASTSTGGSKGAWIAQLAKLRTTIPNLGGIVWYDARDPNGDFRVRSRAARKAFKGLATRAAR
jgi:mannan endo-1,4-beta-mannosidase